jgi:hypothetical protein
MLKLQERIGKPKSRKPRGVKREEKDLSANIFELRLDRRLIREKLRGSLERSPGRTGMGDARPLDRNRRLWSEGYAGSNPTHPSRIVRLRTLRPGSGGGGCWARRRATGARRRTCDWVLPASIRGTASTGRESGR